MRDDYWSTRKKNIRNAICLPFAFSATLLADYNALTQCILAFSFAFSFAASLYKQTAGKGADCYIALIFSFPFIYTNCHKCSRIAMNMFCAFSLSSVDKQERSVFIRAHPWANVIFPTLKICFSRGLRRHSQNIANRFARVYYPVRSPFRMGHK